MDMSMDTHMDTSIDIHMDMSMDIHMEMPMDIHMEMPIKSKVSQLDRYTDTYRRRRKNNGTRECG